jgi:hypothetical protein
MNNKYIILLSLFLSLGLAKAENADPRIQEIDQKLQELRAAWHQNNNIINRLTNNRRTPVVEGSQAHQQCLQAERRMKEAEAAAANLKTRREEILSLAQTNDESPVHPNVNTANQSTNNSTSNTSDTGTNLLSTYADKYSRFCIVTLRVQEAYNTLTASPHEEKMKDILAKAESGELSMEAAEARMRQLANEAIRARSNAVISVDDIKRLAQCDDFDIFTFFMARRISFNQIDTINNENLDPIMENLFSNLDPNNYLNPLEINSNTLRNIGSNITIKGQHFNAISDFIKSKKYKDLTLFLLNLENNEEIKVEDINVRAAYKAASILADLKFYVSISPGVSSNNMGHSRMPWVYFTNSISVRTGSMTSHVAEMSTISGASNNGWEKHPDGLGYIHEWRPRDGSIMLATFNNQGNQPVSPRDIERLTNPPSDGFDDFSLEEKLQKRIDLGELTEDDKDKLLIDDRKKKILYLLNILINN